MFAQDCQEWLLLSQMGLVYGIAYFSVQLIYYSISLQTMLSQIMLRAYYPSQAAVATTALAA